MVTLDEFRAFCQLVGRAMSPAEGLFANEIARRLEALVLAQAHREQIAREQPPQTQPEGG
jgi:hypothetical protein